MLLATADEMFARIDSGELELDLIVIGTPPGNHRDLALAAINRGLNVVVDKPFVPSPTAGEELIAAANKAQVALTVFQNRRWDGDFLTVKRLINDGRLGEIRSFESRFEWWMPEGFGNWRDEAHIGDGGAILHDLGAHLIDQVLQLFGPAEQVHGETTRYGGPGQSDADHAAFVSIMHRSGVRSRLWMNGPAAQSGPRFHILGSKGAYVKWGWMDRRHRSEAGYCQATSNMAQNRPKPGEASGSPGQPCPNLPTGAATRLSINSWHSRSEDALTCLSTQTTRWKSSELSKPHVGYSSYL